MDVKAKFASEQNIPLPTLSAELQVGGVTMTGGVSPVPAGPMRVDRAIAENAQLKNQNRQLREECRDLRNCRDELCDVIFGLRREVNRLLAEAVELKSQIPPSEAGMTVTAVLAFRRERIAADSEFVARTVEMLELESEIAQELSSTNPARDQF